MVQENGGGGALAEAEKQDAKVGGGIVVRGRK